MERHPRNCFNVASKFPTWVIKEEDEIEPIFAEQLEKCGVDFFDYYLIHKIETVLYDGVEGKGGVIKTSHLIDHAKQWKEEGKIKSLGFSFHSSAKLLDRVLTEHPEFEFVQIALNYYDWDSEFVQARKCYEVIRKHGKRVIVMQPVKGGGLARLPEGGEELYNRLGTEDSFASLAIQFAAGLDGVMIVLSGMSTLEQVKDNIKTMKKTSLLREDEKETLQRMVDLYKKSGPLKTADFSRYEGVLLHGVPVGAILDAWNTCQIQPNPGLSVQNNYLKNLVAEEVNLDIFEQLPVEKVLLKDGTDITEQVLKAEHWLIENSF